jgi:hypothetical protein
VSASAGWLFRDSEGKVVVLDQNHAVDDCIEKEIGMTLAYIKPLGTLIINGRTFVFVMEHGWEDESYVISEWRGGRFLPLFLAFGG